jgi:hypothetical protein
MLSFQRAILALAMPNGKRHLEKESEVRGQKEQ